MSRLIDVDALIEKLEEKMFNSQLMCPVIKITDVMSLIGEQPTAFDVENVVAELEESKKKNFEAWKESTDIFDLIKYGSASNAYGDAIGAVKRGGVS